MIENRSKYIQHVLGLYKAKPIKHAGVIHGIKDHCLIHVGPIDKAVTNRKIERIAEECVKQNKSEIHVLGWDWKTNVYGKVHRIEKEKGIKIVIIQIPIEIMDKQAVARNNVSFFELPKVKVSIKKNNLSVKATLKDFSFPNEELLPKGCKIDIDKWSDYIDYWAIDWNFRKDVFNLKWASFRTRNKRSLSLTSDEHTYKKPGQYRIMIMVIDVFGNTMHKVSKVTVEKSTTER